VCSCGQGLRRVGGVRRVEEALVWRLTGVMAASCGSGWQIIL
jgi:hypothetical protein